VGTQKKHSTEKKTEELARIENKYLDIVGNALKSHQTIGNQLFSQALKDEWQILHS